MAREIICKNEDNIRVVFTDEFAPWLLENCEGIYETRNNVFTSANTMTDGSTYQGSVAQMRNIILTLRDRPEADHQANRTLLYALFKPKADGLFIYRESGVERQITYKVESVEIDTKKRSRKATVSLLCPDPYFVDLQDISVEMSGWVSDFEFQHLFLSEGEEFGHRVSERLKTIQNDNAADNIGLTITITAAGQVINPSVSLVEQGESIEIGTYGNPLTLQAGDKLIITTHINNKHVYLERDGSRQEINEYLSEDSEFLQLMHGQNTFGYSADSGESYMTVAISFKYRYPGV